MLLEKKVSFKYIFNKVKYDMVIVTIVGLVAHYLAAGFREFIPEMPLAIPAFLGTAISVLLSFKMNQSYDRWWEARKVWGAIVNDSRSLVIQLQSFVTADEVNAIRKIAFRQIAWCYSLGSTLRGINPIAGIENLVQDTEIDYISKHNNKPLALLQLHAHDFKDLRLKNKMDIFSHVQIDETLTRICDSMGKAERINNTIFPATYRYFLHFIIYVFVITLSVSLNNVQIYFEIPLLLFISVGFFLIEKSAYHLQDPFMNRPSDVSITAIARTIDINLRQLVGEKEIPEPLKPDHFYIL